jgi:thiaminase/transcriptional activator TenA
VPTGRLIEILYIGGIYLTFTEDCRKEANKWWEASFNHPFVNGIGNGTLPLTNFRYYVLQDSYYLSNFARIQSYGAGMAADLYTTSRLAAHAQGTYEAELGLHQTFSEMLNITDEERQTFQPSPTAYAYTSHMYRAVTTGYLGSVISALLPCYWVYLEVGEHLKRCTPEEPVYQKWIQAYHSDWFRQLVEEQIVRLDQLAEEATDSQKQQMKRNFLISSYYEYKFWDMAYKLEDWAL